MSDRFVHIGRLEMAVPRRKPGLREAYMKVGKLVTIRNQPFIQLSDADYQAIRKQFALGNPSLPVARDSVEAPKPKHIPPLINKPGNAPKLPGLAAAAKNAAAAAGRVITAAATGQPVQVPETEFQRRMALCAACDQYIKETQRCAKCSCYLASQVIGKARLATEKCPANKW